LLQRIFQSTIAQILVRKTIMGLKNTACGPKNALTDVCGLRVGNTIDETVRTGVTVILCDTPAIAAVDIRGGGPGTRETDALEPHNLVERIDALVLAGGSVFGLGAADGVAALLSAQGRGLKRAELPGVRPSPIVPSAILYDLANGGNKDWGDTPPYNALGRQALNAASTSFSLGNAGAGYGALAGALKGGLGSASICTQDGITIGALAAVNSFGSVLVPGTRNFWAAPYEINGEFGAQGWPASLNVKPDDWGAAKIDSAIRQNTTLGVVALSANLSVPQAKRLAIMAQDGLARAIRPAHAPFDGDIVFALATGDKNQPHPDEFTLTRYGALAADCLARAIARGVYEANGLGEAICWRDYRVPEN
jgi:L-aminopeptidase/D-esterase-like protein